MQKPWEHIDIYAKGIVHCSVCVPKDMSREDIETGVNFCNPTGISSQWEISKDKTFADTSTNPSVCGDDENKLHYLMVC